MIQLTMKLDTLSGFLCSKTNMWTHRDYLSKWKLWFIAFIVRDEHERHWLSHLLNTRVMFKHDTMQEHLLNVSEGNWCRILECFQSWSVIFPTSNLFVVGKIHFSLSLLMLFIYKDHKPVRYKKLLVMSGKSEVRFLLMG